MTDTIRNYFQMAERKTKISRETAAGITTFATMSYIIFLQPAIMTGQLLGIETGMPFDAVLAGTCLSAAFASILMGVLANYPIGLAAGMGENFFFVLTALGVCATTLNSKVGAPEVWKLALGVVLVSGVIFAIISFLNIRKFIMNAVSPSMKAAIAAGIGLFIALLGLKSGGIVCIEHNSLKMASNFLSANIAIFVVGLTVMVVMMMLKARTAMLAGILAGAVAAMLFGKMGLDGVFSAPPDPSPVFAKADLVNIWPHIVQLLPLIIIFTFMDVFDTLGTLIGVSMQAGLMKNNELPNAKKAFAADATGTIFGALCGNSTVTSYIESAAGVAYGGRTGLAAVVTGVCFLLAMFFAPVIKAVAGCPAITAPALVIVGVMMLKTVVEIEWEDLSEAVPSFLIVVGIPFTSSIADGMIFGFITYPLFKLASGRGKELGWLTCLIGVILVLYLIFLKHM